MAWRRFMVGLVALAASFAAGAAGAHPHVWITNVATFVFGEGKIVAVRLEWHFDEFYGAMIAEEFDKNRDRRFDPGEVAVIQEKAFANLKNFNYFTTLRAGRQAVTLDRAEGFAADIAKGTVRYRFTLPLPAPIDPTKETISLSVFDPTYYIEVLLDRHDPVRYEGEKGLPCQFRIDEDKHNPIYFGMVFPLRVALQCGGS
jgi:ABC-type uncharacterized transport system substrate-binding protein